MKLYIQVDTIGNIKKTIDIITLALPVLYLSHEDFYKLSKDTRHNTLYYINGSIKNVKCLSGLFI